MMMAFLLVTLVLYGIMYSAVALANKRQEKRMQERTETAVYEALHAYLDEED
ncbi:hypothetical protein [Listeria seeligeri]|uniref:hypothetical protein n=1 Tax=Listeria seeligeri TaxID=1640 RepID=UPI00162A422A|nr:hypothetical protein [Listeria seeligeri]MBC1540582.1 hypothetical protein [Listeria seeligeri]MBC1581595.1 hypothetical protein [Listeria seeligeri]MBC2208763.1 hypothetical protein [Listeria seeligeri]MBC2248312.1 hypothetical protein [Listeria seeligeri]MBF2386398.1 hypothetical protein [Listeria seeligeri]